MVSGRSQDFGCQALAGTWDILGGNRRATCVSGRTESAIRRCRLFCAERSDSCVGTDVLEPVAMMVNETSFKATQSPVSRNQIELCFLTGTRRRLDAWSLNVCRCHDTGGRKYDILRLFFLVGAVRRARARGGGQHEQPRVRSSNRVSCDLRGRFCCATCHDAVRSVSLPRKASWA